MTPEQRRQLEEDEIEPEAIQYEQRQVDKHVFNKDTNRRILRNLMENGIKVAGGSRLGKTIIFARNHNHAVLAAKLFDEMYPQYGGNFCRVIDNYDPRAEELIDDFKGEGKNPELTIAISVDMLDTGIDIPEVVNLVFAKPVYSYIKFWQMIGRGTRLCPDLFGPGQPVSGRTRRITAIVLAQEPDLDLTDLLEYYPETAGNLAVAIRSIIGLNAETVNARFTAFAQQHKLNSTQLRFLDLLKNHIRDFGAIELDQLYETPFTSLDKDGLDGVFPDEQQAEEIDRPGRIILRMIARRLGATERRTPRDSLARRPPNHPINRHINIDRQRLQGLDAT